MIVLENEKYICIYHYEGSDVKFEIESSSIEWLKGRILECSDFGKKVYYKIYAVIEEGIEEESNW